MLIDFTEKELLTLGKLLAYVGGNQECNSVMKKIELILGRDIVESDWKDVKFFYEDFDKEVSDFHLYIKIEETI